MNTSNAIAQPRIPRLEWFALAAVLGLCNLPLLFGSVWSGGVYFPDALARGDWWRVITHAFVHVSPYHLFIDGIAVVFLLRELASRSTAFRALTFSTSLAGSLLASMLFAPAIADIGLCGLSGVAHGLMAAACLLGCRDQTRPKLDRQVFAFLLLATVAKVLLECTTGSVFFASSHLGDVGTPIVVCHAGGLVGGLLATVFIACPSRACREMGFQPVVHLIFV